MPLGPDPDPLDFGRPKPLGQRHNALRSDHGPSGLQLWPADKPERLGAQRCQAEYGERIQAQPAAIGADHKRAEHRSMGERQRGNADADFYSADAPHSPDGAHRAGPMLGVSAAQPTAEPENVQLLCCRRLSAEVSEIAGATHTFAALADRLAKAAGKPAFPGYARNRPPETQQKWRPPAESEQQRGRAEAGQPLSEQRAQRQRSLSVQAGTGQPVERAELRGNPRILQLGYARRAERGAAHELAGKRGVPLAERRAQAQGGGLGQSGQREPGADEGEPEQGASTLW